MGRRLAIIPAMCAWVLVCALTGQAQEKSGAGFTDITDSCGIGKLIVGQFEKFPKWWLSGLYLIDLDGDNHLDFVTGAHGAGEPIAALNDGKGHFVLAPGYKGTEVHICCDINEDGKVDLQMNFGDGGGKWWLNQSAAGRPRPR